MKKIIFLTALVLFLTNAKSQITKGYWLAGGSGSYSSSKSKGADAINSTRRQIEIQPSIGYFMADKLAAGIRVSTVFTKDNYPQTNGGNNSTIQNLFGAGPFIRYYFLDKQKQINIFSDANISYSLLTSKNTGGQTNKFKTLDYSVSAGSVIFLNSAVGLEFILGYNNASAYEYDSKGEKFSFRIGFQIHLEKDNK